MGNVRSLYSGHPWDLSLPLIEGVCVHIEYYVYYALRSRRGKFETGILDSLGTTKVSLIMRCLISGFG